LARELFVNPVASTGPGVGLNRLQAVVGIKALKEQIPEGDQGVKEPVVEALGLESRQSAQRPARQELDKEEQQLGRSEWRLGEGFWLKGVFLDGIQYAYIILCIQYMLYSPL
jgi:hypothetical protein